MAEPNPILEGIKQLEQDLPLRISKGPSDAELRNDAFRQRYYDTCAKQLSQACTALIKTLSTSRRNLPDLYSDREESMALLRRKCAAIRDLFAALHARKRHFMSAFISANGDLHEDLEHVRITALEVVNYLDGARIGRITYQLGTAEDKLQSLLIALHDVLQDTK